MYKYLLLKQRQKYKNILLKYGITESPSLKEVDSFLGLNESPKITQRCWFNNIIPNLKVKVSKYKNQERYLKFWDKLAV